MPCGASAARAPASSAGIATAITLSSRRMSCGVTAE
jgi:hypothetical protein